MTKSYIEWGDVTFYYDFYQIRKIVIFCIGNPIVKLMDFEDFEEFSSFFTSIILYRKFNSKFPNFMTKWKLFGKIKISHRIFYQKPSGFLLHPRNCILFLEIHSEHSHSWRTERCTRKTGFHQIVRVYCMAFSYSFVFFNV